MYIPEFIKTYGFIFLLIGGAFWLSAQFIAPPPPDHLTIAAGSKEGAYYGFAERYKEELLEKYKITVTILETKGAMENARLLQEGKADAAFMQSGLLSIEENKNIESLGSLYFEPLWVFVDKNTKASDIRELAGEKLAVGGVGAGTRAVAELLLRENGVSGDKAEQFDLGGQEAYEALQDGKVDAAFFVSGYGSPLIQTVLQDENVALMSFRRAESYARKHDFLSRIVLPEGIVDFARNIPPQNVSLVSPVAMLTVRNDFHGALKTLLVQAAETIHGHRIPYINDISFPTPDYSDLPVSDEAARYYKYGPSFLQRYLPFWMADMVDRLKIMLIPLLGVMLPLSKAAPPAYRWRIRSKIYKWYKSLKKMEDKLHNKDKNATEILKMLDDIEDEAKRTPVPLSYAEELYNLRLHIKLVREHIETEGKS